MFMCLELALIVFNCAAIFIFYSLFSVAIADMKNMSFVCAGSIISSDSFRRHVFFIGFSSHLSPHGDTLHQQHYVVFSFYHIPKWPMIDRRRLIPLDNPFKSSENTDLQNLVKPATSRLCHKSDSSKNDLTFSFNT